MYSGISEKNPGRIFYLDYLRAFIIIIVIVLHSLLPYVIGYDWNVNDQKTLSYTIGSIFIDVFIMPIMFFIAGYFAFPTIRKKGIQHFLMNKLYRIALPFVIGVLFFAPIITYIGELSHGRTTLSYWQFWAVGLSGFLSPRHYWFLSLLFIFLAVFGFVYYVAKDGLEKAYEKSMKNPVKTISVKLFLTLFFIIGILAFFVTALISFDGNWLGFFKAIAFQPTRATIYLLYFVLGIIVFVKRIDLSENLTNKAPLLAVAALVATIIYVGFKIVFYYKNAALVSIQFFNAIAHFTYCFVMLIALLAWFKKYMNKPSKIWGIMAADSYTIYFFHMVITVWIQYVTLNQPWPLFVKFTVTFLCTCVLSFVLSEIWLKTLAFAKKAVK